MELTHSFDRAKGIQDILLRCPDIIPHPKCEAAELSEVIPKVITVPDAAASWGFSIMCLEPEPLLMVSSESQ